MEEKHTEHAYELLLKESITSQAGNSQYDSPCDVYTAVNTSTSATPPQNKSKLKKPVCSWLWMCAFILVGSPAFASLALTVWNISQVNLQKMAINDSISNAAKFDQMITMLQTLMNSSKLELKRLQVSMNNSTSELEQRILQLQNSVNDHYESQSNVSRSLSSEINNIIQSLSGQYSNLPAASCSQILLFSPSDHYWIRSSNGSAVRVYCDFNRQCGCDGPSGWARVAFLNMSDPNQVCPSNWTTISTPVRTCGKVRKNETSCDSVFYSTFGLTYSRVCGRIMAYQNGNTDAFKGLVFYSGIDQPYVDGVSLTHGSVGSRQHIWSFASAIGEEGPFQTYWLCACSNSNNWTNSTLFVGKDYFCDSGNHLNKIPGIFHSKDLLWDGQGCGSDSTCCQFNKPPWFCKTLTQSTTDDLEVRLCNHGNSDDTPVQLLELYVQ